MNKPINEHYERPSQHDSLARVICKHCVKKVNDQGLAKVSHLANCKGAK